MTTLTESQKQALTAAGGEPLRLLDPETNRSYVLLPSESYDRFKALFEDVPFTLDEQQQLLRRAGERAGWDDPAMDVYDDLDPRRP